MTAHVRVRLSEGSSCHPVSDGPAALGATAAGASPGPD